MLYRRGICVRSMTADCTTTWAMGAWRVIVLWMEREWEQMERAWSAHGMWMEHGWNTNKRMESGWSADRTM